MLFVGPNGTALVDSGYSSHAAQTLALVQRALGTRALDLLLNTHLHSDHCGGNAALQLAYPGVRTLIPPGLAASVRDWDPVALSYTPTGQQCPRFRFDAVLTPGQIVMLGSARWQIHAAPGHDPHSVILFEPVTRTLISADALWENGFGIVFEELEGVEAFDEVAATLDLIESLAPQTVIPGHGAVFTSVSESLATARSRLESLARDPAKHARHAAKVLVKFKLLEAQRIPIGEFRQWALATVYFGMVHRRFFADLPLADWIDGVIADLVHSGAAQRHGEFLSNA